jgi:4-amino-4-deoxy-L-arabinose transferase-like glycosyltransferase
MKRELSILKLLGIISKVSRHSAVLLGVIGFILLATLVSALLYPPNNYDSMTYHLARVPHWISNGNVSLYPTSIDRQNYQPPLSGFVMMHLQVLSGADFFANLVQWFSFLVSIVLGYLIAGELGLSIKKQLLTSVVIATMPMAILQSSSTQNDLVVTSLVLSFALFMLRLRRDYTFANILFTSLSMGLALLTKGTAFIYCAGIGLSLAIPILLAVQYSFVLLMIRVGGLALVVLISIALNSGHFWRKHSLYGSPIATGDDIYTNDELSLSAASSNILKNIGLHLGTRSERFNEWFTYRLFQIVLGEELNNPKTMWLTTPQFRIPRMTLHEDIAGNFIHMLAILIAIVAAFYWIPRCQPHTYWYVGGVFLAAILFCLCLRWQIWGSRLHTPLFALIAPVIVIAFSHFMKRALKYVALSLIVCMIIYSIPFAIGNETRPLWSLKWLRKTRMERYFRNKPELYDSYRIAMDIIIKSGVKTVGLYLGGDDWEYPLWVLGRDSGIQFHHVGVTNISKILNDKTSLPEYVIATKNPDTWPESSLYEIIYHDEQVSLLKMHRKS